MNMLGNLAFYIPAIIILLLFLTAAVKILREYERGVIFTLGRFTSVKGPGLILLIPYIQQMWNPAYNGIDDYKLHSRRLSLAA